MITIQQDAAAGGEVGPGTARHGSSWSQEPVCRGVFEWAAGQGYIDAYGDPARGFAGAYEPSKEHVK